ncbi:hypothetical protein ACVWWD_002591 [Mesorhizobium sp. URHB0026]
MKFWGTHLRPQIREGVGDFSPVPLPALRFAGIVPRRRPTVCPSPDPRPIKAVTQSATK